MIGPWWRLGIRFDSATKEKSVYLNGWLVKQERSTVVPNVDRPMPLLVGGDARKKCRFTGQVRNLWLGNQDKFSLPAAKSPATAATESVVRKPVALAQADVERNVANWVLSLGGKVKVTSPATPEQNPVEIADAARLPAAPFLLFGIDLGQKKPVTGNSLASLDDLANLVEFEITGVPMSGEGIAHLARQRNLTRLTVRHANLTDADLAAIGGLPRLQNLYIGGNKVTDAGVAHLRGLPELRMLQLSYMPVTGDAIKQLYGVKQLTYLGAQGTEISDAQCQNLVGLKAVNSLDLTAAPRITDLGMKPLGAMPSLIHLTLNHTAVSDQGLEVLARFPGLKRLELTGSKVTDAGVQKFKAARPDCEVVR
jgi:Leucine-rich repeat (LRR) protein